MIHSSGKRGRYKRYLSMLIAFIMVCSVFLPAFAENAGGKTDGEASGKTVAVATYEFYADGSLHDSQTVKDGETLKEPSEPKKGGSTFKGWYTEKDGGSKFTDFSRQTVTEDKTVKLYAGWQENEEPEEAKQPDEKSDETKETDIEETETVESEDQSEADDQDGSDADEETASEESDSSKKEDTVQEEETEDETSEEDSEEADETENVSEADQDETEDTDKTDAVSSDQQEEDSETDETEVTEPSESSNVKKEDAAADDTEKSEDESDTEKNDTENVADKKEDTADTADIADTSDDAAQKEENIANVQPQLSLNTGISPLNISGPTEVAVGDTIELMGGGQWVGRNHHWSASPEGRVALQNDSSSTVSVTGLEAGTVTLTHIYYQRSMFGGNEKKTETHTITVTEVSSEQSYPLYAYTLIPGKTTESEGSADEVWNGMGVGNISGVNNPDSYTVKVPLDNGYESSGVDITYPTNYPDITVDGEKYEYADIPEEEGEKGFYTITWFRVVVDSGANTGANGHNPVIDSGTKTFHLDGYITLNEENQYTVDFKLKDAGEQSFEPVAPEKYTKRVPEGFTANQLLIPNEKEPNVYPQTKVVDGITYKFDGWYKDQACTEEVNWDTETITDNITYYAQYVPVGKNITIAKDVTGGLGDVMKDFSFTYSYSGGNGEFTLKDGGEYIIENVPIGTTLTLTETNAGGYITSANYGNQNIDAQGNKESETKTIQITVNATYDKVTITNNKEAIVDVGIRMDNLPYILMLALVAGGAAAAVILRRRRS